MTALVGQYPDTGAGETLDEGIQPPQGNTSRCIRNILRSQVGVEEVEDGCQLNDVAEDIVQTLDGRPLETMFRDSVVDVLNSIVGNLEFVSVRVNQLSVGVAVGFDRRHGGERSRRCGRPRRVDRGTHCGGGRRNIGIGGSSSHGSPKSGILARNASSNGRCHDGC